MIVQEFSFGNFKSFKEIQTLNLSAARITSKDQTIDRKNVILENGGNFLKSKAIYGANASGKSNIFKAFQTFIQIVKNSVKDEEVLKLIEPFRLSTETENEPSFFQIIYWHQGIRYRYGFEANSERIIAEWLYVKSGERELRFFIRDDQTIIEIDKTNFIEGYKLVSLFEGDESGNEIFRTNSLFISSLASFGFGKKSQGIVENLSSIIIISGLGHQGMYNYAGKSLDDPQKKEFIVDLLQKSDIGIENLEGVEWSAIESTTKISKEIRDRFSSNQNEMKYLVSTRNKYNDKLEFEAGEMFLFRTNESEGTRKLFELSPYLFDSLTNNRPLIIDELDARLHPLLTEKILGLYNSDQNTGAQLVFITHDTNLLSSDLFRRDQVEFVEKDKFGGSQLFSLVQFKGIRNTASFEKDYIRGKYGAIPFLRDFEIPFNSAGDA